MEKQVNLEEKKQRSCLWRSIGVFFIIVIVLFALLYAAHFYYLKIFTKQTDTAMRFDQLQQEIKRLDNQSGQLTDKLTTQQQAVTALQQTQTGFNRNEWLILEAEFLTKLANDKLQLEGNVTQAIQLLQAADAEIRNLNDANLLPLRKALADDIANLQTVPKVDIQGTYLQLAALGDQLNKLPLVNKTQPVRQDNVTPNQALPWWKKGLFETWQALKQIVVVRYYAGGKPPLVLPQEQNYLYMNLHLALEKAMWALIHQQPAIYKSSLDELIKWVHGYFVTDSQVTQSVLHSLEQLQTIDIKPSVPSVSASLQAFQEYFLNLPRGKPRAL